MRCHFLFACFSDGGSDLFSPKKRLEPCSEDESSDIDGQLMAFIMKFTKTPVF